MISLCQCNIERQTNVNLLNLPSVSGRHTGSLGVEVCYLGMHYLLGVSTTKREVYKRYCLNARFLRSKTLNVLTQPIYHTKGKYNLSTGFLTLPTQCCLMKVHKSTRRAQHHRYLSISIFGYDLPHTHMGGEHKKTTPMGR
jgi:hypothetical protein